jgi:tetratricopeptide (TPR) repeat protein
MYKSVAWALAMTLLLSGPAAATLDEAAALIEAGSHQTALEQLSAQPGSHRSRLLRANALAGLQRHDEAEALYRALIAELPHDPAPYNNLATLYAATGRLQEASELLTQAMKSDARYAAIYKNLSRVYVAMSSNAYARALRVSAEQPGLQLLTLDYRGAPTVPTAPTAPLAATAQVAPLVVAAQPAQPIQPAQPVQPTQSAPPAQPVQPAPAAPVQPAQPGPAPSLAVATPATLTEPPPSPPVAAASSGFDAGGAIVVLKQWARAWSAQDVAGYLGAYDADYLPPNGLTLAQWQAQRRVRLLRPGTIEVSLGEFEVSSGGGGSLTVKAVQHYRSDHYRDRTRKGFVLVPRDGGWKIGDEYTIEVLN